MARSRALIAAAERLVRDAGAIRLDCLSRPHLLCDSRRRPVLGSDVLSNDGRLLGKVARIHDCCVELNGPRGQFSVTTSYFSVGPRGVEVSFAEANVQQHGCAEHTPAWRSARAPSRMVDLSYLDRELLLMLLLDANDRTIALRLELPDADIRKALARLAERLGVDGRDGLKQAALRLLGARRALRAGFAVNDVNARFVGAVGRVNDDCFELRRPEAQPRWLVFTAVGSVHNSLVTLTCRDGDWAALICGVHSG